MSSHPVLGTIPREVAESSEAQNPERDQALPTEASPVRCEAAAQAPGHSAHSAVAAVAAAALRLPDAALFTLLVNSLTEGMTKAAVISPIIATHRQAICRCQCRHNSQAPCLEPLTKDWQNTEVIFDIFTMPFPGFPSFLPLYSAGRWAKGGD
jgi:hypothetical protein